MPFLLAVTLAAAVQPACSWDRPGQNPYTGSAAAAIDRYTDIPAAVRGTLKRRMEEGQSDDQVSITRDGIAGKNQYAPEIRDMHFGSGSLCNTVTRAKWAADRVEPAMVYCVGQHCILVPKICGNVSRITRGAPAVAAVAEEQSRELEGTVEFADMGLVDAEPRDEEEMALGQFDELDEDGDRRSDRKKSTLRSASTTAGGVDEFVMEQELDLDDLASAYARRLAMGFGNGDSDGEIHTAVPEAGTWAMLLGGLGLVGWFSRRRARAETAA